MARGNTAGRCKSTQPLPGIAVRTASPEPHHKNSAPESYEHQQLRRFAQALSNPDWRNRRSHNRSSASSRSESSARETIASAKRWARRENSSTDISNDECKCEDGLAQVIVSQNPGQMAKREISVDENTAPFTPEKTEDSVEDALDKGLYQIARQINLTGLLDDADPLTVFEVVPFSSSQKIHGSDLPPTVVEIQSVNRELRTNRVNMDNSQNEQLTAALEAADITPRKVRATLSPTEQLDEIFNCCRRHHGYQVRTDVPTAAIMTSAESKRDGQSCCEGQEIKQDGAFQRMLQKLTRNRGQDHKPVVKGKLDSGHERIAGVNTVKERPLPDSTLRYPVHSITRRMGMASDFTVSYVPGSNSSHRKEDTSNSVDSGVCMEEQMKFKTLNPRAREFLSFAHSQDVTLAENITQPFEPVVFETLAGKRDQITGPLDGPLVTTTAPVHVPAPRYEPILTASRNPPNFGGHDAFAPTLHELINGNTLQFQDQLSKPVLTLPPPPTLGLQPVLQPIAGNILSIPPPNLVNAMLPMAGSINPGLVAPSCPLPFSLIGAVPRPPPVPKPRRPDPGDQQAYEAWIEWRKANEPGYALECKLRQQRRAQRNMDRPKFQPGKNSEVATAA